MNGSRKASSPVALEEWISNGTEASPRAYPIDDPTVRRAVIEALLNEQRGLCVYCGRKLDERRRMYHIEHFRPQALYPERSLDFSNLFLSCGPKNGDGSLTGTCGDAKGGWFDENHHISPDYPACVERFSFLLDGRIVPRDSDDADASEMIARLNLEHSELRKEREDTLRLFDQEKIKFEDFWDGENSRANGLAHIIYSRLGRTLP